MEPRPFHILISRKIRLDRRAEFDELVRGWVATAIQHPGYLGVMMHEPADGREEHIAILRFRHEKDWELFRAWPLYQDFLDRVEPMVEGPTQVERLHGLEGWFPRDAGEPPRWKMALLTWLGVNGMVWAASEAVNVVGESWPFAAVFLTVNALVVAGLTWVVMPLLTRLFGSWLRGRRA